VVDRQRAREVGDERDAGLERRDQQRLEALVVGGDLGAEPGDAGLQLVLCEEDLADARVESAQEAFRSP
jgi:hypothetical protein